MSIAEKVYLGMVLFLFFGFMLLVATLSWLDAKENRAASAQRKPVTGKPASASGKPVTQH